ncbi:Chemotaxis signal transduction protein [Ekhidna lutea]|uniref:Chemotaxis signal transduction protein n=1 Tax=Ekhidna lutea TaxID=447679 RepID=A0A239H1B9_EKHLU|nr:chemotaxis protein CheW [Ekhidna lutea]SNS75219.1 Chemotaxis signal transduction protein [Ekhidna lutea]
MALGKNLKKQQLIASEKKKSPKKKVEKKKLIKKSSVKKKATEPGKAQIIGNFITEKEQKRKQELRKKFREEIESLSNQIVQFVVFNVGNEEYAVEIAKVSEVVSTPKLSEAPNSPAHVKGIASIRGKTFLAMDLRRKFVNKSEELCEYFLAVKAKDSPIGFLLNSLPVTLKTSGDNITSDVSMIDNTTGTSSYIKGLIQLDDRIIFYLDIDELVRSDHTVVVPDEFLK